MYYKIMPVGHLTKSDLFSFFLPMAREDLVPIIPGAFLVLFLSKTFDGAQCHLGRFLGYHHPSGEVHIMDNEQWVSCPGEWCHPLILGSI